MKATTLELVCTNLPEGHRFISGLGVSYDSLRLYKKIETTPDTYVTSAERAGLQYLVDGERQPAYEKDMTNKFVAIKVVNEKPLQSQPHRNYIQKILNLFRK